MHVSQSMGRDCHRARRSVHCYVLQNHGHLDEIPKFYCDVLKFPLGESLQSSAMLLCNAINSSI